MSPPRPPNGRRPRRDVERSGPPAANVANSVAACAPAAGAGSQSSVAWSSSSRRRLQALDSPARAISAELRPQRPAAGADRSEHLRLCRRRLAPRHPRGEESRAGDSESGQSLDEEGDSRDRGPPVLQSRRDRSGRHRTRSRARHSGGEGRRGRIDDHPAARTQPLHRQERAHPPAQSDGSLPCDSSTGAGRRTEFSPST